MNRTTDDVWFQALAAVLLVAGSALQVITAPNAATVAAALVIMCGWIGLAGAWAVWR